MTLLCADIGNSHTSLGLLDGDRVTADWRVATEERRTADEWAVLIRGLLDDRAGDVHADAALYAVDALEPGERAAFELHLRGCAACREEVAAFAEVGAHLAAAVADAAAIRRAAGQCLKRVDLARRLRLLGVRAGSLVRL